MKPVASSLTIVSLVLLAACSNNSNNSNNSSTGKSKTSLGSAMAGETKIELLTDAKLETGLTPIYIKVTGTDGNAVTDANLTFLPVMSMSTGKKHSCPVLGNPAIGADDLYRVDVVFQMASSDMDTWDATVGLGESDAEANQATFPKLDVTDSGRAQVLSYTDPATSAVTKYVSSLNFVSPPQVGLNPVIFTLHTPQPDMMSFTAVDDATIALDPQMPSMGHGSSGSVNPTATTLGRYEGKLSFSMAGTWETTVTVNQAGVTLGTPTFTTTF